MRIQTTSALALALSICCSACVFVHVEEQQSSPRNPGGSAAPAGPAQATVAGTIEAAESERVHLIERVDEVGIIQLYADGFAGLDLREKTLIWHLYQAAIAGRDIYIQQRCAEGLDIRDLCEEILVHSGDVKAKTYDAVRRYMKLFWVNNSPYASTTARKYVIEGIDEAALAQAATIAHANGARLPLAVGESPQQLVARLAPMLFDPAHKPIVTDKNPADGGDPLIASAMTYYGDGVTMADVEAFDEQYELNSTVVKDDTGGLTELVWRAGWPEQGIPPGLYAEELEAVIGHLEDAIPFATEPMAKALEAQIRFYRTGERADRVAYDIAWVADGASPVDTINSFVEVYVDPRGKKGGWEAIVFYEDPKKAELIKTIADNAQWFEDHMPFPDAYKKPEVKGITARSIDVVIETGDSGPVTPIGINLPNDNAVREEYGSKSVSLANVIEGYAKSSGSTVAEFAWDEAEVARAEKWGSLVGDLLTNMHEVIGHASGRMSDEHQGVDPSSLIKEYTSALEEGRSDLVGLYFMMDPKLEELGLLDDPDEAALASYERYVRNGAMQQLRRIAEGNQIEEDHMRNRQMVVRWIEANSESIEERKRDGKTYYVVTDAAAFREAAGRLLTLCQTLKSTGDYEGTKALFDTYGRNFDEALRDEVLARYETLDTPAYSGFVQPRLTPVRDADGTISDVRISYPLSLEQQMLEWSGRVRPAN